MTRRKRAVMKIIIATLLFVLIFPFRSVYRDGGTLHYKAVLYEITKYHIGVGEYTAGWNVKILGFEIYENRYTAIE